MELKTLTLNGTTYDSFHASDEQIASAVEDYMAEHPVTGGGLTIELKTALVNYYTHVMPNFDDTNGLAYINAILTALGAETRGESGGDTGGGEEEPDEPVNPEVTLSSISATYSGGDVAVGTAVNDLTGVVVTAHYSDGTSEPVTDYTLSGTIAEGSNTVTVSYGGKTTTFTVTGVAESGGNDPFAGTWVEGFRLQSDGTEYATGHASYDTTDYVDCGEFSTVTISAKYAENIRVNAVAWYDASKNFISGEGVVYINNNSETYPASSSFTKPNGAAYCRLCGSGFKVDGVEKRFAQLVTITVS